MSTKLLNLLKNGSYVLVFVGARAFISSNSL